MELGCLGGTTSNFHSWHHSEYKRPWVRDPHASASGTAGHGHSLPGSEVRDGQPPGTNEQVTARGAER